MKTLANTSPFLLLLVPVFMMILLAFAKVGSVNRDENVITKVPAVKVDIVKAVAHF